MVAVTIEGLLKEGVEGTNCNATLDLPQETELAELLPLLEADGFQTPDSFTREDPDGACGLTFDPSGYYTLKYFPQKLEVVSDRPSNFHDRCININDSFIHFSNLREPSTEMTAKLDQDRSGRSTIKIDDRLELTFHRTLRMPDDDKIHPLPASRGVFPLYNVDAFASRLPERITKRGGIFFPMWQREALWIRLKNRSTTRYALRVSVGHINAISGLDIHEKASKQDYVVVPDQEWLDGIAVAPGVVRQFVAMPLGSGYTVEGQVSGEEKFGGIQIEVIPAYEQGRYSFRHRKGQGKYETLDEHRTPGYHQLESGDTLSMAPNPPVFFGKARVGVPESMAPNPPTFYGKARVGDFLTDDERLDGAQNLIIKCSYSDWETDSSSEDRASLVDPLIGFSHDRGPGQRRARGPGGHYIYSDRRTSLGDQSQNLVPLAAIPTAQEMGIAAGGKLVQDIVHDKLPQGSWNIARAMSFNIHILHPSGFEAITHILPPKTPITMQEYIEAGIPFYAVEEDPDERIDGSTALAVVKSVSAMDQHVGVKDGSSTEIDPLKPKRCATCSIRLCDCIVRPCNHQFCHVCIKAVASPLGAKTSLASSEGQKRCPVCSVAIRHVAGFSAPMNLPGEETFKVDVPVVMLKVEDGRAKFESVVEMRL